MQASSPMEVAQALHKLCSRPMSMPQLVWNREEAGMGEMEQNSVRAQKWWGDSKRVALVYSSNVCSIDT